MYDGRLFISIEWLITVLSIFHYDLALWWIDNDILWSSVLQYDLKLMDN